MQDLHPLTAISPLDGRYWAKLHHLSAHFSEFSLMRYRVLVEIEYFIALVEIPLPQLDSFDRAHFDLLRSWYSEEKFTLESAQRIKALEKQTNHDVKAVEYYVKECMDESGMGSFKEFIHFGLTSQDINNTAIPLSLKDAVLKVLIPSLQGVRDIILGMGEKWREVAMLARTHGQPATPTRIGKELLVFVERIDSQMRLLKGVTYTAKFSGATGAFNAHVVAYPAVDWIAFGNKFISKLGLERSQYTTQIGHYDDIGVLSDNVKRINTILLDFSRDMWTYISMEYFKQTVNPNETGSSAMPHKVNPIDFENAEGNLGMANAIFEHFSAKLPISRLQRDLTDSTVLRNLGVPFGHTILSLSSLKNGLSKLTLNEAALHQDLEDNWVVVSEALQTILRREGFKNPYETLKALTRTSEKKIAQQEFIQFIEKLEGVEDRVKEEMKRITPFNYIGVVPPYTQ